jgi:cytoskeletal protein RodZ
MSLEQLSKTVDFVQDATPSASDANDGETYLDTSQSPPQLKIFDAGAGAFVRPRSVQNLDAPVSGAGATQSDIETAVDNSSTGSTIATNLDAKVSNTGVDWASKTPKSDTISGGSTFTVNGSGYLLSVGAVDLTGDPRVVAKILIDGVTVFQNQVKEEAMANAPSFIWRFDSKLEATDTNNTISGIRINYVLD